MWIRASAVLVPPACSSSLDFIYGFRKNEKAKLQMRIQKNLKWWVGCFKFSQRCTDAYCLRHRDKDRNLHAHIACIHLQPNPFVVLWIFYFTSPWKWLIKQDHFTSAVLPQIRGGRDRVNAFSASGSRSFLVWHENPETSEAGWTPHAGIIWHWRVKGVVTFLSPTGMFVSSAHVCLHWKG